MEDKMEKLKDQPVAATAQPSQEPEAKQNVENFEPKLSTDEYVSKWRLASAEASDLRKERSALKKKLDSIENQTLEEQGKYKEMYEKAHGELTGLKGAAKRGAVRSRLQQELLSLGCNPAVAEKAIRFADLENIEVDSETYAPDMEQVKYEAKRIKEEVPVFFGKGYSQPKDGVPGSAQAPTKSIKELSNDELDSLYHGALGSLVQD